MILVKDKNLNDVLIGNKHVSQIYLGNQLVWESAPTVFFDNAPIVPWAGFYRTGYNTTYDEGAINQLNQTNTGTNTYGRIENGNIITLYSEYGSGYVSIVTQKPIKVPKRMKYLCVHAKRVSVYSPKIRIGFALDGYTTPGGFSEWADPYLSSSGTVTSNGDEAIFYCEIPEYIIGTDNYHVCLTCQAQVSQPSKWQIDKVWFDKIPPEDGRLLTY